jgi:LEA14-like dessication related protein
MEGSTVWKWARRVLIAVVLLIGLVVLLFATGVLGVPSAGVSDVGDWGEVTDERTEIVTTVWVDNPNPVGLSLGDSVTVDYDVFMNDVQMAEGSRSDISVSPGNNTQAVRTDLRNDRLNEWWAGFIEANETIDMAITTEITVDAILSGSFDATMEQRLLEEETPVIDALSGSVNSTSGEYTATADGGSLNESALRDTGLGAVGDRSVTVGYEVERGWATWESANESTTTVLLHMDVHNPGDVPVPAAPDGIGFTTEANDVTMFEGETEDMSLRSVGPDATIAPGETREVTVAVDMDNDNIDDWFTSHVRNGEVSQLSTQFQVVFEEPISGETFRIPGESDATYDCEFRTAMLVDDQASGTTCGEGPAG